MGTELTETQKEQVVKIIAFALSPIKGIVESFEKPLTITYGSREGNQPWKERSEVMQQVCIKTKFGEGVIYLSSSYDTPKAVWEGCYDYCRSSDLGVENRNLIAKKLFGEEAISLLNQQ
jgi:hypothetical protein